MPTTKRSSATRSRRTPARGSPIKASPRPSRGVGRSRRRPRSTPKLSGSRPTSWTPTQGRLDEAAAQSAEAVRLKPGYLPFEFSLANTLLEADRVDEAISHFRAALRLEPAYVPAHESLASALERAGRTREASAERVEALRFRAWIRATHENPSMRNAGEAIRFAEEACRESKSELPGPLDALAAAYAEAGRFAEALELARGTGQEDLARGIAARLAQYDAGRPRRDPSLGRIGVSRRE